MAFSIRLTNEEKCLADSYAKLHAMSPGDAFKPALFDKIEDEYDLTFGGAADQACLDSGKQLRPFSELKKELDL